MYPTRSTRRFHHLPCKNNDSHRHVREHDVFELAEERVALEGVAVPLEDRVGRQEGAVEGVVVLPISTTTRYETIGGGGEKHFSVR